jgi:hypothetical protein
MNAQSTPVQLPRRRVFAVPKAPVPVPVPLAAPPQLKTATVNSTKTARSVVSGPSEKKQAATTQNYYKLRQTNISRENYADVMGYIYQIMELIGNKRIPASNVLKNIINIMLINIKKNIQNLNYYNSLLKNLSNTRRYLSEEDTQKLHRKVDKIVKILDKDIPVVITLTGKFEQLIKNKSNYRQEEMDQLLVEVANTFFRA